MVVASVLLILVIASLSTSGTVFAAYAHNYHLATNDGRLHSGVGLTISKLMGGVGTIGFAAWSFSMQTVRGNLLLDLVVVGSLLLPVVCRLYLPIAARRNRESTMMQLDDFRLAPRIPIQEPAFAQA